MAVAIVDGPGTAPLGHFLAICTPVQWSWEGSAGVQVPVRLGIARARSLVANKAVKRMQEDVDRFDVVLCFVVCMLSHYFIEC